MDINAILKTLPHRYPMLLVDRILEIEPGVRAVGLKNVTINEPFFQGHWPETSVMPETPVMPGVLQQEALYQLAGVLATSSEFGGKKPVRGNVSGIKEVRYRGKGVIPGDQLILEVEACRGKPGVGILKFRGTARVGELVVCEIEEFTLAVEFATVEECG